MNRLKEGIVEVNGVVLSPETTLADMENIGIDKAVQRFHGNQFLEVIFNQPIEDDGVTFQVSVKASQANDSKVILLDPKLNVPISNIVDESRAKQEICEEWLKRNMDVEPTRDTDDGIVYSFPWGHITSTAAEHINFGHIDGCILLTYDDLPMRAL